MPAVPVSVIAAATEVLPVEVRAVGTVEPFRNVQVKSQVAGDLVGVRFTEGGLIQQGACSSRSIRAPTSKLCVRPRRPCPKIRP